MTAPNVVNFACSPDMAEHVAKVFAGEYEMRFPHFQHPPRVVDVGACFGEFARWARIVWDAAEVVCVEPNPRVLPVLRKNLEKLTGGWSIVDKAAVADASPHPRTLYTGPNNIGESSLDPLVNGASEDGSVLVEPIPIWELGPCDVLKLDCEGGEPALFESYLRRTSGPAVVLAEYHRLEDLSAFIWLSREWNYHVAKVHEHNFERGIVGLRGAWLKV